MNTVTVRTWAHKTDAGKGSNGICCHIGASRSPSPDPQLLGADTSIPE